MLELFSTFMSGSAVQKLMKLI